MIINSFQCRSESDAVGFLLRRTPSFLYLCPFKADPGVCASESELASNWPFPTLSTHAPCPSKDRFSRSKQFQILSNYSTALFSGIRARFDLAVTSILLAFSLSLKTDTVLQGSWPGFALGGLYHYSFPSGILCLSSCLFVACFLVSEVAESPLLPAFSLFLHYPEGWIQFRKITISL